MSFFLTVFTGLKVFLKNITEKNLKIFSAKYHMPEPAALESTAELKSLIGFPDNQASMCLAPNIDALLKGSECLSSMDGREYVLIVDEDCSADGREQSQYDVNESRLARP